MDAAEMKRAGKHVWCDLAKIPKMTNSIAPLSEPRNGEEVSQSFSSEFHFFDAL